MSRTILEIGARACEFQLVPGGGAKRRSARKFGRGEANLAFPS
jgi:hypothetical protein